jgi:hypothetical protein
MGSMGRAGRKSEWFYGSISCMHVYSGLKYGMISVSMVFPSPRRLLTWYFIQSILGGKQHLLSLLAQPNLPLPLPDFYGTTLALPNERTLSKLNPQHPSFP